MFLKPVIPHPQLAPFIRSFWIFQSDLGHPASSSRVIAPNGRLKIVLPLEASLFAQSRSVQQEHKEGKIQFIGNADEPYVVNTYARCTGTLIIELTPQGACRFAPFAMSDITNNIVLFTDIYGQEGCRLEEQIGNTLEPAAIAALLQDFMVKRIQEITPQQGIVDYAVNAILKSNGCIRIETLEKQTGYSRRYLDMLFKNHVGLSPKTFSSVTRFQYFHLLWAKNPSPGFYRNEVFKFYYDQAHFIKEFKRFSGQTPEQYAISNNELGRIFCRD